MTVTRYLQKGIQDLICYLQPQAMPTGS
jgi:RNA polymerase sigma-B factor